LAVDCGLLTPCGWREVKGRFFQQKQLSLLNLPTACGWVTVCAGQPDFAVGHRPKGTPDNSPACRTAESKKEEHGLGSEKPAGETREAPAGTSQRDGPYRGIVPQGLPIIARRFNAGRRGEYTGISVFGGGPQSGCDTAAQQSDGLHELLMRQGSDVHLEDDP